MPSATNPSFKELCNRLYSPTKSIFIYKLNYLYLCKYNDKLTKVFKKEDLEIVIATMNRNSLDFLIPMFPFCHFSNFPILIVNQTHENKLLFLIFLLSEL